jgi:CHRD domain
MKKLLLALGLGILVFAACNSTPALPTYKATLSGAAEKPTAVTTAGTGDVTATLDGTTLTLKINFSGLSGAATGAHVHGPVDVNGVANPPICLFTDKIVAGATAGTGSITATCPLDATLTAAQLDAGQFYVNLHTDANKGGEVRGQLIKQ